MLYIDTSLLLPFLTVESVSLTVEQWFADQLVEDLGVSEWVVTETASVLSLKQRTGQLTAEGRQQADYVLSGLLDQVVTVLGVSRAAFRTATRMCQRADLSLRGPDALHLAVATEQGAALCTRDIGQARAARLLGLEARLVEAGISHER